MAFTKITRATTLIKDGWGAFNTLVDDLLATSNGKGASQIGIEDSAGNVAATNVEDAIAEVYTDHSTTKALAETFDENPATTTGLLWGYKGGLFRLDNVVTTVAASTISVANNDVSYVEIIPSTGNVSTNTTGFTSGRIPLRQITVVSGTQTVSTDKRAWFSQVAASTTTTSGIVELATNAEVVTGTDTGRAIVPSSLTAKTKDEDNMASDSDEHLATQKSIKAYVDERTPPGSIMLWPTDTAPTGWLECAGASLLRAGAYNPLYLVIGDAYGTADGTHFNLPDWSGMFLRSWDHGAGIDPNAATRTVPGAIGATISAGDHVGTEQDHEIEAHKHRLDYSNDWTDDGTDGLGRINEHAAYGTSHIENTGGDETRPINVNVMVIIKY